MLLQNELQISIGMHKQKQFFIQFTLFNLTDK